MRTKRNNAPVKKPTQARRKLAKAEKLRADKAAALVQEIAAAAKVAAKVAADAAEAADEAAKKATALAAKPRHWYGW